MAFGIVLFSFDGGAFGHGGELFVGYGLEDFAATTIAGVCIDLDGGFDIGDPSYYASDGNKMA